MKILITSIIDLKKSAPQRPHHFIKYLSKKHDITVICVNDCWKEGMVDSSKYYRKSNEYLDGVDVRYITTKKMSPIQQELLSPYLIKLEKCDKFDILFNYNTLVSGYYLARKLKIPMVYDLADDLPAMIADSPQIPRIFQPIGERLGTLLLQRNIHLSKMVTGTSISLKETFTVPDEKFGLTPNGVNTDLFQPRDSDVRTKLRLNDSFVLGYVGVLREWVDFAPVFKAIQKLENVKLLIVGEEGNLTYNKDLAKQMGIEEKVIFAGTVPHEEVPDYISAMDVCLIPFKNNGISQNAVPLKLFEYLACNKPVLSTKLRGVQDIMKNKIYYANSDDEYLDRIQRLSYLGSRSEISEESRDFVVGNYDWKSISGNLERTLEEYL